MGGNDWVSTRRRQRDERGGKAPPQHPQEESARNRLHSPALRTQARTDGLRSGGRQPEVPQAEPAPAQLRHDVLKWVHVERVAGFLVRSERRRVGGDLREGEVCRGGVSWTRGVRVERARG